MYSLPNHQISGELKSSISFWMYPSLWTSLLVAMHDDIENTSINFNPENTKHSLLIVRHENELTLR